MTLTICEWLKSLSYEWCMVIATFLLVLFTALLALATFISVCGDMIIKFFIRPDFKIVSKPFMHRVPMRLFHEATGKTIAAANTDYIRIEILNEGNASAKDVEVLITEVRKKQNDGKFKPVPMATPYSLQWTHRNDPSLGVFHHKTKRHITLGYIYDPKERHHFTFDDNPSLLTNPEQQTLFTIAFSVKSSNREYLIPHGEYEFDIQVVASNMKKPVRAKVYLNHNGEWFMIDSEMYEKGIEVKIYPC